MKKIFMCFIYITIYFLYNAYLFISLNIQVSTKSWRIFNSNLGPGGLDGEGGEGDGNPGRMAVGPGIPGIPRGTRKGPPLSVIKEAGK